jgi:hypothetical protein
MSYSSRVYRQRNPKAQEDSKDKPFFSKQKQDTKGKKGGFFQAKGKLIKPGDHFEKEADSVANRVVNQPGSGGVQKKEITPVQRLASTPEEEKVSSNDQRMERDKEKPFQSKAEEPEKEKKPVQKMDDPNKKKEPVQKMDDAEKKKEPVQKMNDADKKKEPVQKMDDPNKKKEPVQKMDDAEKKKEPVQKADDKKDKELPVQKMETGKDKEKKPEKI